MKNLLGRLMGRSFEELKVIATTWHITITDLNHNDAAIAIYREMAEKTNVRAIWETLDVEARVFLHWLLEQRNQMYLVDELPVQLNRPDDEVDALLARLGALGLCDVEEAMVRGSRVVSAGDNLYAWGQRNQTPAVKRRVVSMSGEISRVLTAVYGEMLGGEPFDEALAVLLDRLEPPVLERIAARWHVPDLRYTAKPAVIEMLDAMLEGAETRERMLAEVNPDSRRLFDYLCAHDGQAPATEIMAAFTWSHAELHRYFAALEVRALAFETLWHDRRVVFVPRQVRCPQLGSPVAAPQVAAAADPPVVDTRMPFELPWNLLSTMAYFAQNDVVINRHNNELPKRALKRLQDSFLTPPDAATADAYLNLVLHFAESLGLVAEEDESRRKIAGGRQEEWVHSSFAAQARRLFGLWLEDRHLREDPGSPIFLWRPPDPTSARKHLMVLLAQCPLDTWLSIDSFLQHVFAVDPYLLVSRDDLVRQQGVKGLRDFNTRWMSNEGVLITTMISHSLLWLGAVDVGKDRSGKPVAFRITAAGARLFNHPQAAPEPEPAGKPFLVQPNFEVLVLAPEARAIWTLLQAAELTRHDRVSVYTLNKESVLRARARGISPDELQAFLVGNSRKAVPQNVLQCISDWARAYKRTLLEKVTILEVEDAEVLDELLSSRRLKGFVARRLSPTVALIKLPRTTVWTRDDPWQKLAKELRTAGYFPEIVEEAGRVAKPRTRRTAETGAAATAEKGAAAGVAPAPRPRSRRPLRKNNRLTAAS
ncbi:MAG TPA: helicase-associated domain-containing protein [Chloroflexia bacterium]|nr:helicase-associated domain-containing protein [Chloroflexia bacterium]